LHMTIEKG